MDSLGRLVHDLKVLRMLLPLVSNWPALLRLLRPGAGTVALTLHDGTRYAVESLDGAARLLDRARSRNYDRLAAAIADGWNVVDIGAGPGEFTIFAARRTPHGRVYAYEAEPAANALLYENLGLNQVANVTVFPYAVAGRHGTQCIPVSAGMARPASRVRPQGIEVRCVTLDDVLKDLPAGRCDYMKISATGAETEILLNASAETLARIGRIYVEYHTGSAGQTRGELARFLIAHGWRTGPLPPAAAQDRGFLFAERPA